MVEININCKEKIYPIILENESVLELKNKIQNFIGDKKYIVVISSKVEKLYGKFLNFPKSNKYILPDGEKEKNFKNYQKILDFALKNKLDRKSVIVAIGGGVVGDLSGFAASTYMRGIDFVQVPTTLLACTDSSVGGKTAINTKFGKNLVGTFYQPSIVFINPIFLKTLDNKQFYSGMGEVIKYSLIEKSCLCDEEFNLVNFINEKQKEIFNRDEKTLIKLIEFCVKLKKSVVEKDEKENNLRQILNFGHTLGHAIEKINNYKKYTHGEAVIEGIKFAFNLAIQKKLADDNYRFFALDFIKKMNFKNIQKNNYKKMVEIMTLDKKVNSNKIKFVLPVDYSRVEIFEFSKEDLLNIKF